MSKDFDHPVTARKPNDTTELRGECPHWVVNVLDAVSMSNNETRTALVNRLLGEWATKKVHEASLIAKLAGINPTTSESTGGQQ